jgi:hypothetical protein
MKDLDLAKKELYENNLTLVIVKNGKILFQTDSHRISGFLDAIEKYGQNLEEASIADRVVGKAVALLCVYAKIKEVYASVLSQKAQSVLKENQIGCQWKELVENVLNIEKTGLCPFEKTAANISNSQQAYQTFRRLREQLQSAK